MEYAANDKTDQLLAKFLAKETTPAEEKEMLSWVERSEANLQYFHQFSLIWHESQPSRQSEAIDENAAWSRFITSVPPSRSQGRSIRLKWLQMVAAVLVIAGGISLVYFINRSGERSPQQIVSHSDNSVKTDTLPDRSVVTLNKKAILSYPSEFKGAHREVQLQGEAFFDIQPDKTKPFIIDVAGVKVKVVGTSFNIKNTDTATEIIVRSGIVQVIRNNEILELKKGEQTVITSSHKQMEKSSSTDQLFNYYVSHTFVCDNTPLWKLVDKLNEAYGVNITITRKELRAIPLTVTFNDESLDTIFNILSQTLMLKVTRNGNDIILQ